MAGTLSAAERAAALKELPGWREAKDGKAITRTYGFADFNEAFGFMARAALVAEKMDHHPDWSNAYKTVDGDAVLPRCRRRHRARHPPRQGDGQDRRDVAGLHGRGRSAPFSWSIRRRTTMDVQDRRNPWTGRRGEAQRAGQGPLLVDAPQGGAGHPLRRRSGRRLLLRLRPGDAASRPADAAGGARLFRAALRHHPRFPRRHRLWRRRRRAARHHRAGAGAYHAGASRGGASGRSRRPKAIRPGSRV